MNSLSALQATEDYTDTGESFFIVGSDTGREMVYKQNYKKIKKEIFKRDEALTAPTLSGRTMTAKQIVDIIYPVADEVDPDVISIAEALFKISEQYEQTLFSYSGVVSSIERNASGEPTHVSLIVSVDGKDVVIRRSIKQFNFEIGPNIRVIVEGVKRGSFKKLVFRPSEPIQLSR